MATRAKIVVTYDDGRTEDFNPNRPRFLLDMENRWNVQSPERHEHIVWLAHHALVVSKGGDMPLEDWVDTVEDIDTINLEQADGDGEGKDNSSTA